MACAENLVTSAILYPVLVGIMDIVMPSDFSPAMRAAMLSQVILVCTTMVILLGVSVFDRSALVMQKAGKESRAVFRKLYRVPTADERGGGDEDGGLAHGKMEHDSRGNALGASPPVPEGQEAEGMGDEAGQGHLHNSLAVNAQAVVEDGNRAGAVQVSSVDEMSRMLEEKMAWEDEEYEAEVSRRTDLIIEWMMDKRLTYRVSMEVANAYSVCVLGIFLMLLCMVMQAASGSGLSHDAEIRANGTIVGEEAKAAWRLDNSTARHGCYISSSRSDWIQSSLGTSVGWYGPNLLQMDGFGVMAYTTDLGTLPMAGSVFAGVVLAFLGIATLLAIYLSLAATPEGERSYCIIEPRGLIIVNGIVSICSTQGVERFFATCQRDAGGFASMFIIFCAAVCWLDEVPAAILGAIVVRGGRKESVWEHRGSCLARLLILLVMCFVPPAALSAGNAGSDVPGTVLVRSFAHDCLAALSACKTIR